MTQIYENCWFEASGNSDQPFGGTSSALTGSYIKLDHCKFTVFNNSASMFFNMGMAGFVEIIEPLLENNATFIMGFRNGRYQRIQITGGDFSSYTPLVIPEF